MVDMTSFLNESNGLSTINLNPTHLIDVLCGLTCLRPKPV